MTKSAYIAVVGRTNVGKSSLINLLVGEKVAIVTHKPQTTRTKILGILTKGDTQLIFVDTPGLHNVKTKLGSFMLNEASASITDVDLAIFVTDTNPVVSDMEKALIESINAKKIPLIILINKIDTLKQKTDIMEKIALFSGFDFKEIIPVSVHHNDGIPILLDNIYGYAKEGPFYYDGDSFTDKTERYIAAEIIREKMLLNLEEEIPHGIMIEIESMKLREDKPIYDIHANIICEKRSHKSIILGKNGGMIKKISTSSRIDIEEMLGCRVNLKTWVKIKEDWRNKEFYLSEFGFK